MHKKLLAPSLLAGDHSAFGESLAYIESAGLEWVHLDIMDGHFVPNLSFGPQVVKALRAKSQLFFDTHLMLDNPHLYIEPFVEAGSDLITVHVEPDYPIKQTLADIKSKGCQCGLALNPGTSEHSALPYLEHIDLLLLMTVQPGFGGQAFRKEVVKKIKFFNTIRQEKGLRYRIEVDGGIDAQTAPLCTQNGADTLVAGTAFFNAPSPEAFQQQVCA